MNRRAKRRKPLVIGPTCGFLTTSKQEFEMASKNRSTGQRDRSTAQMQHFADLNNAISTALRYLSSPKADPAAAAQRLKKARFALQQLALEA